MRQYAERFFGDCPSGGVGRRQNLLDVARFLTYAVQECGAPVRLLPPSRSKIHESAVASNLKSMAYTWWGCAARWRRTKQPSGPARHGLLGVGLCRPSSTRAVEHDCGYPSIPPAEKAACHPPAPANVLSRNPPQVIAEPGLFRVDKVATVLVINEVLVNTRKTICSDGR